MAVDPTYPLLPGLSLLSSALLFCLLATSFVRHSWNLGLTFLCFWLFWENLLSAVNAIVWSDNAAIKLYVYCDILTHVCIVRPACTLILTRRLYKIASLRSIMPESRRARVIDAVIEWSLGLGLPLLVTGAFCAFAIALIRFLYNVHQTILSKAIDLKSLNEAGVTIQ